MALTNQHLDRGREAAFTSTRSSSHTNVGDEGEYGENSTCNSQVSEMLKIQTDTSTDPSDLAKTESKHSRANKKDVDKEITVERQGNPTNADASAKEIISFKPGDPENPQNWSNVSAYDSDTKAIRQ